MAKCQIFTSVSVHQTTELAFNDKIHLHWTTTDKLLDVFDPAAFDTLHRYTLSLLLLIELNARTAELDTTFPDDVVHTYCATGLAVTEQLTDNGAVSFNVILADEILSLGTSISKNELE